MAVTRELPATPTVALSPVKEMTLVDAEEYTKDPAIAVVGGVSVKSDPP
ncbi:unannotated protein [freshwater metagenome]|uniref:Unannotated protein n=1 Tax=freshwater metagenome TaxID=449393 RepID=A0A6J6BEY7_9ZZZZ